MTIVTSAEMSGMMSQQQAMFYNNALVSQQISASMFPGSAPAPSAPMVGTGAGSLATKAMMGAGAAAPGLTTAAGFVGGAMLPGMAGTAAGMLDPFGMAIKGGMAGFRTGGMMGALGGASVAALPAAAVVGGAMHVTQQATKGMQEQSQLNAVLSQQNFMRPGGRGFSAGQMGAVGGMLRSIDQADPMSTFGDLTRMVDQMHQQGLMAGVGDLEAFQRKFKEVLNTTKEVASIMGSTLEEALPFVADVRRSGFYTAADITGQAVHRQMMGGYGFNQRQMQGVSQTGAAISQMHGGFRRAGAMASLQNAQTLAQAMQMGVISDDEVMEATGGVGGAEGLSMLSNRMTQQAFNFTRTSVGRAMMAATGEIKEGRYTGGIDRDQVALMQLGVHGVGNIKGRARGRLAGASRISFKANEERMRGEFAREHGVEMIHGLVQDVTRSRGYSGATEDDVVNILMKRFTDLSRSEADLMVKISKEYTSIQDQKIRTMNSEMDRVIRDKEYKTTQSWESRKRRMKEGLSDAFYVPELREWGGALYTATEEWSEGRRRNRGGGYSANLGSESYSAFLAGEALAPVGSSPSSSGVPFGAPGVRLRDVVSGASPTDREYLESQSRRVAGVGPRIVSQSTLASREATARADARGEVKVGEELVSATRAFMEEISRSDADMREFERLSEELGGGGALRKMAGSRAYKGSTTATTNRLLEEAGWDFEKYSGASNLTAASWMPGVDKGIRSGMDDQLNRALRQAGYTDALKHTRYGTALTADAAEAQQTDMIVRLSEYGETGRSDRQQVASALQDTGARGWFTTWAQGAGSRKSFERRSGKLWTDYVDWRQGGGKSSGRKLSDALGMPQLTDAQAEAMVKHVDRIREESAKEPGRYDEFQRGVGMLENADRVLLDAQVAVEFGKQGSLLSNYLTRGKAARETREAALGKEVSSRMQDMATNLSKAENTDDVLEALTEANAITGTLSTMSKEQQEKALGYLYRPEAGALGMALAEGLDLKAKTGRRYDRLKQLGEGGNKSEQEYIDTIAAVGGLTTAAAEGLYRSDTGAGRELQMMYATPGEKAVGREGKFTDKEIDRLSSVLGDTITRSVLEVGASGGPESKDATATMTEFLTAYDGTTTANANFISAVEGFLSKKFAKDFVPIETARDDAEPADE